MRQPDAIHQLGASAHEIVAMAKPPGVTLGQIQLAFYLAPQELNRRVRGLIQLGALVRVGKRYVDARLASPPPPPPPPPAPPAPLDVLVPVGFRSLFDFVAESSPDRAPAPPAPAATRKAKRRPAVAERAGSFFDTEVADHLRTVAGAMSAWGRPLISTESST